MSASSYIQVDIEDAHEAIYALEYKAHMEAGLSMAPDLIEQENTAEWKLAQKLRGKLKARGLPTPEEPK